MGLEDCRVRPLVSNALAKAPCIHTCPTSATLSPRPRRIDVAGSCSSLPVGLAVPRESHVPRGHMQHARC